MIDYGNKSQITLSQIPVHIRRVIGGRGYVGDAKTGYLHFTVGRGQHKITVTLEPSDTYTVRLMKFTERGLNMDEVKKVEDVYCDRLGDVILELCDDYGT
jgi:hypothetical protein